MTLVITKRKVESVIFTSDGSGQQLILKADPRRVYVKFRVANNSGFNFPVPYPKLVPDGMTVDSLTTNEQEYKFKDCPAIVTDEWYIFDNTLTNSIAIITETYVGD